MISSKISFLLFFLSRSYYSSPPKFIVFTISSVNLPLSGDSSSLECEISSLKSSSYSMGLPRWVKPPPKNTSPSSFSSSDSKSNFARFLVVLVFRWFMARSLCSFMYRSFILSSSDSFDDFSAIRLSITYELLPNFLNSWSISWRFSRSLANFLDLLCSSKGFASYSFFSFCSSVLDLNTNFLPRFRLSRLDFVVLGILLLF